jgi:MoaA/NifB/PqqE/SkfB family radical SAM enzyme
MLSGLLTLNIELSSLCNKNCWMCGRRKIDRDYPELKLDYGFMDFALVEKIAKQVPPAIIVQFHNNGEPLMYPRFKEAVSLFTEQIKCTDTNGKLLLEKQNEIIDVLDTITVSTFEKDEEGDLQLDILEQFLKIKGSRKPNVVIRMLGNIEEKRVKRLESFNTIRAKRVLHSPMGSFFYKKEPVIPETGICLEMMSHPAININGDMSICVRFDPERKGVLGNLNQHSMEELWNGSKRKEWLIKHVEGNRESVPLCQKCEFWGVPRG